MITVLDAIAARAQEHLQRESVAEAFFASLQRGVPLLPAGAAMVFCARFAGPLGALPTIGLAIFPYLLYVALQTGEAIFAARVDRATALGRVDRELDLHDRLRTADEFLGAGTRTGFMDAAIADAESYLATALETELEDRARRTPTRGPLAPTAAFLILLAALQISPAAGPPAGIDVAAAASLPDEVAERGRSRDGKERPRPPAPDARLQGEPPDAGRPQKESSEQTGSRDKTKRGSASTGRTARTGGSGSQARSAEATGSPSAAGRASSQKIKMQPKKSKSRKKRRRPDAALPKTPPRRESGATSGSAKSSGSSKNPTASDWKTRDTPPDQTEDPETDDEEIDDEPENSESRGGVQPNLRSRKPPVNRDLGIGFGNRANKRSNGRGGASQRKKSRGTASLVLGVPLPDHIKGQPNPGMTKVTRERGEPEREAADPVRAGKRARRAAPAGTVPRAELPPWLAELVRRYFGEEKETDS